MPYTVAPRDLTVLFPSLTVDQPCLAANDPFEFHINATLEDDSECPPAGVVVGVSRSPSDRVGGEPGTETALETPPSFLAELRVQAAALTIKQNQLVLDVVQQFLTKYCIPAYLHGRLHGLVQACLEATVKAARQTTLQALVPRPPLAPALARQHLATAPRDPKTALHDPFPEAYAAITRAPLPELFDTLLEIEAYNATVMERLLAEKARFCQPIRPQRRRRRDPAPNLTDSLLQGYLSNIDNPATLDFVWDKLLEETRQVQRSDYRTLVTALYRNYQIQITDRADDPTQPGPASGARSVVARALAQLTQLLDLTTLRPLEPPSPTLPDAVALNKSMPSDPSADGDEQLDYDSFCRQYALQIHALTEMGFEREQSITSLQLYQGDMDRAVNVLVTKPDIINFHRQKSPRALSIMAHLYAGSDESSGSSPSVATFSPTASASPFPSNPVSGTATPQGGGGSLGPLASPMLPNGEAFVPLDDTQVPARSMEPMEAIPKSPTLADSALILTSPGSPVVVGIGTTATETAPTTEPVTPAPCSKELRQRADRFALYTDGEAAVQLALTLMRLSRAWINRLRVQLATTGTQTPPPRPWFRLNATPVTSKRPSFTVDPPALSTDTTTDSISPPEVGDQDDDCDDGTEDVAAAVAEELQHMSFLDDFSISMGKPVPLTHHLRLSAQHLDTFLRFPGHPAQATAVRAQTATSIYSPALHALVLVLTPQDWDNTTAVPLNTTTVDDPEVRCYYLGNTANRQFFGHCHRSTDYHFPSVQAQLGRVHRQLAAANRTVRPGDVFITRHSNLPMVHVVFHLVLDAPPVWAKSTTTGAASTAATTSGMFSQQTVECQGLVRILDATTRHKIQTLTLTPHLLADPAALLVDSDTTLTAPISPETYLRRRCDMIYKCVKGFLTSYTQGLLANREPVDTSRSGGCGDAKRRDRQGGSAKVTGGAWASTSRGRSGSSSGGGVGADEGGNGLVTPDGMTIQFLVPGNVTEVEFNEYRSGMLGIFRVD